MTTRTRRTHSCRASATTVLVTGGAGYLGSLLTGVLLSRGCRVTVVDNVLFGGESLLGYWHHPKFRFVKGNVCDTATLRHAFELASEDGGGTRPSMVVHLAAIVGFPACREAGHQLAWKHNVEATRLVFEATEAAGAERFLFASTYSNYGLSKSGEAVTEDSPLYPQSLYAETKIAAEQYLLQQATAAHCAPIVYRFATLFGISPRTRFDLIVNQFVLEALTKRKLVIYQRGCSRSFVHVRDVCEAIALAIAAPPDKVRGQVFNVGSEAANYSKDEIVELVRRHVDGTRVEHQDLSFGGDMRDIQVSFAKVRAHLGFAPKISVEQGVVEVRDAIQDGIIRVPLDGRYRNADFLAP